MVGLKNPGLFEKELTAFHRAKAALEACQNHDQISKEAFETLLENYRYLLRRYERHLTISDRIEGALKAEASTDHLTGLLNRKAFENVALSLQQKRPSDGSELYMMVLDLDGFKAINDTFGHAIGDRALQEVSEHLLGNLRSFDVAGRIGGEEFAILASVPRPKAALHVAERLRSAIESLVLLEDGKRISLTASIGVTNFYRHADMTEAFKAADALMYKAKKAGRNQVVIDF